MTANHEIIFQGAESKIFTTEYFSMTVLVKERFIKKYRNSVLDDRITKERIKAECRNILKCKQAGIRTPAIYNVDLRTRKIYMEYFKNAPTVKNRLETTEVSQNSELAEKIGETLSVMHKNNIIHGDLTTSNMLIGDTGDVILIDFGLSQSDANAEDKGVDLYVLEKALLSTHPDSELFFTQICNAYRKKSGKLAKEVFDKFEEVRARGRKRTMVG